MILFIQEEEFGFKFSSLKFIYIYIYREREREREELGSSYTWLLNWYFENPTIELHVLYVFNIHANFHINWMLFTIWSINSYFMYYFKLQKLEFKQLIDDMAINLWSPWNFAYGEYMKIM